MGYAPLLYRGVTSPLSPRKGTDG